MLNGTVQGKRLILLLSVMCLTGAIASAAEDNRAKVLEKRLKPLVRKGCVLVADREHTLFRYPHRCNPRLVPASALKIITALAGLHILGPEFRFQTKFYLSPAGELGIRGYGDPMLISEEWRRITGNLAEKQEIPRKLKGIFLDDSALKKIWIPFPVHGNPLTLMMPRTGRWSVISTRSMYGN